MNRTLFQTYLSNTIARGRNLLIKLSAIPDDIGVFLLQNALKDVEGLNIKDLVENSFSNWVKLHHHLWEVFYNTLFSKLQFYHCPFTRKFIQYNGMKCQSTTAISSRLQQFLLH